MLRWLDRNLWAIPALAFVASTSALTIWILTSDEAILLSATPPTTRSSVYSSLTGAASSLLGFTIAAIAILAAFSPRRHTSVATKAEASLARARSFLILVLLATSLFLLTLLVASSFGIAMDSKNSGNPVINVIVTSSIVASITGLIVSGLGLTLAVLERTRND